MNRNIKNSIVSIFLTFSLIYISGCQSESGKMGSRLEKFAEEQEKIIIPLYKAYQLALLKASISGKEADYDLAAKAQMELIRVYSNKKSFEELNSIKKSKLIKDEILKNELEILLNEYNQYQVDEKKWEDIILLEKKLKRVFSEHKIKIEEEEIKESDIDAILVDSTNNAELEKYWKLGMDVGKKTADEIVNLVKKRNVVAEALGFKNFYDMKITLSGLDVNEVDNLFDELDMDTRGDYAAVKDHIDEFLTQRLEITKDQLMPWHFQNRFFYNVPSIFNVDFNGYYQNTDIVGTTNNYFKEVGIDITDILQISDLYEKPGKTLYPNIIDIDRSGDIRIASNIKKDALSIYTLMYQSGYSAYLKYIDRDLAFVLRQPANDFTAVAVGNVFSRFVTNAAWMKEIGVISDQDKKNIETFSSQYLKYSKLVFSRWAQVVYRFEKSLYYNPEQDLNTLWWDMVENYQMLKRPPKRNEPDWAARIDFVVKPCSYHNYILGDLFASQLYEYITKNVTKGNSIFVKNENIGDYLIDNVFKKGSSYTWNNMIYKATGDSLSSKYFKNQFTKKEEQPE